MIPVVCIAEALNKVVPGGDFVTLFYNVRDPKFPAYIIYNVEVFDNNLGIHVKKQVRVNGTKTDADYEKRKIASELIAELLQMVADGEIKVPKTEIKF